MTRHVLPSALRRALLALAAAVPLVVAPGAVADASAAKWKGQTTIHYLVQDDDWAEAIDQGVSWINRMPGPIRFVETSSKRKADVLVGTVYRPNSDWLGRTGVYTVGSEIVAAVVELNEGLAPSANEYADLIRAEVAAHEMLHAVGLEHRRTACSLMGVYGMPELGTGCRTKAPSGQTRCGPQRTDAKELIRLYGGELGSFKGYRCPLPRT